MSINPSGQGGLGAAGILAGRCSLPTRKFDKKAREVPTMADRTLRGSRMGAVSYETEYGAEPAPRNLAAYACPRGHEFTIPFSEEADVPATWECRLDGATAQLVDGPAPEAKKTKPARTHWDMLMERRTVADLEEVLAERLDVLRARRGAKSA